MGNTPYLLGAPNYVNRFKLVGHVHEKSRQKENMPLYRHEDTLMTSSGIRGTFGIGSGLPLACLIRSLEYPFWSLYGA